MDNMIHERLECKDAAQAERRNRSPAWAFLAFQPLVKDWAEVVPEPWDNRVEEPFRAEAVSYLPAPIFNKLKQY